MELIQVFNNFLDQSNPNLQSESFKILEEILNKPETIQQFINILANREIPQNIRQTVSVFMSEVIRRHCNIYIENTSIFLNDLLNAMINEEDVYISSNIAFALFPIYQGYGENLQEMVNFIDQMCTSENLNAVRTGSIFLIEFLPTTNNVYLQSKHQIIIPLLKQLLSSYSPDIQYGFELFAAVQAKNDTNPQADAEYAQIFQQMLLFYQQSLQEKNNLVGPLSQHIAISVERETLFDSTVNLYNTFIQIASNGNIHPENRIMPLFIITSLVKSHGEQVKSLIPNSIPLFLAIAASQFIDADYESQDYSPIIINLFEELANVSNEDDFYEYLMNVISQDANPATSFASLCAINGVDDILLNQFEQNVEKIVGYLISKLSLQCLPVAELSLIILNNLVVYISSAISPLANKILEIAFQLAVSPEYLISKKAIMLISSILQEVESLETSFILANISSLKGFYYQSPSLKPEIMDAIASAIHTCGEDIQPYVQNISDVIIDGLSSDEMLIVIPSVEALGKIMAFAPEQTQELYQTKMEFLLQNSVNEETDLYLKHACIDALYNIVRANKDFNSGGQSIEAFLPFVLTIALAAIGIKAKDEELYSDTEMSIAERIILAGFFLLKSLLKYHAQSIKINIARSLPEVFKTFVNFPPNKDISIKAIQASVYYLLEFKPGETDLLARYISILRESRSKARCKAVFKAYNKLILKGYEPAINVISDFMQCVLSALLRELPCQLKNFVDDETRFNFNPDFMEPVYTLLCDSFKINLSIIEPEKFLSLINSLLSKVNEIESFEILGTCGDYIIAGGMVNNEIIQFGLNKIVTIDYSKPPDSIYFIRSLIKMHPEVISGAVPNLLNFLISHLQSEESEKQYYSATMSNVISTLFDISKSESLGNLIQMNQVIPLILNKMPVLDDDEAQFIYSSLIDYFQKAQDQINNNLENLVRVLIQTLSLKKSVFNDLNLQDETIAGLIHLTKIILQSQPELQQHIPGILNNDEVKINRLNKRMA